MKETPEENDPIQDELRFHLETEQEELEDSGLSPDAARFAARRELGNVTLVTENVRDVWARRHFDALIRDLRLGVRSLRREPGFTAAALLCLTLGIGANTAVFSCVNAYLLQSLPYPEPGRLVAIFEQRPRESMDRNVASYADYFDWKQQSSSFAAMGGYETTSFNYMGTGEPERVTGATVTTNFFDVLDVKPWRGRNFAPEDDVPGRSGAIITYGFGQRHFANNEAILGQVLNLDGRQYTVYGILAPDFVPPVRGLEIFVPIKIDNNLRGNRGNHSLFVLARLKSGVSLGAARSDLEVISRRLEQAYAINRGHYANVVTLSDALRSELRPAMLMLLVTVALVLLIACFNVANLLLARSLVRAREIAVRLTLGGSSLQIVRQLLTESVVLSLSGGVLGVGVAFAGVQYMRSILPAQSTIGPEDLHIDGAVLAFTTAVSILSGILFGLAPAITATRGSLSGWIKSMGRGHSGSRWHGRQRALILTLQTGVAVLLLIGAGLLVRSFWKMQSVNPGFRPDNLLTMQISLPSAYREDVRKIEFQQQMIQRVTAIPGVTGAGFTSFLPFAGQNSRMGFVVEGIEPDPAEPRRANWRLVTPGYMETMKIPLERGRYFAEGDHKSAPVVMLINEYAARRYWKGRDPIGTHARLSSMTSWATVVGVVGDVKHWGLEEGSRPEAYLCSYQAPFSSMNLVVRTQRDPEAMTPVVRSQLRAIDATIPALATESMEDLIDASNSSRRFLTLLVAGFAVLALILAAGGTFAQVAYATSQRSQEIGIRMALGASRRSVVALMMRQVLLLVTIGGVVGIAATSGVARFLKTLLFGGIQPLDALTLTVAPLLMIVIAALACTLPSWRATKTDPATVLRAD
jgi:putative ABC transport system permease protein